MSYNTTIIEKTFRGNTMAVFANPPLPPLNGPLCDISEDFLARLEKRTGGAGITSDLVLRGLGGDLLGTKVFTQGLEDDVEGGGGLAARVCCVTNLCDASCYCTRHLSFVSERVTPR